MVLGILESGLNQIEFFQNVNHFSAILFFVVILVYWYLTRNHNYWSLRGIPGPKPLPFFGTYLQQFFVPFQVSEQERFQKYGKIYGIYDGTTPGLIVGEPRLIKQIMVGTIANEVFSNRRAVKTTHPIMSKFLSSLEGSAWKRVRTITAPTFTPAKLKSIIPIMKDSAEGMLKTLERCALEGTLVDLKDLFGMYTMDIIAQSAFATIPDAIFVNQASQLFTFPFWRKFLDYVIPMPILDFLRFTVLPPGPMDFFREITERVISDRRARGETKEDFLELLLKAHSDDVTIGTKVLSQDEILSQAVLFFSVGYETSSQLLMYAAYCLALHPEIQDRASDEVVAALAANGNKMDSDILPLLVYTTAVIDETLRLYNPVLRMERRAARDFELEGTGIQVPKGMVVGIPVWAIHHSEEYYPDPWVFNPDRFLPGNRSNILHSTYLPFGQGNRNCIGQRFALLECKLALAKVLLRYKFVQAKETKVPMEFFPTGRPLLGPKSVFVRVETRK